MAQPTTPKDPGFNIDDAISDALDGADPESAKHSLIDDHPMPAAASEAAFGDSDDDDLRDMSSETRVMAMSPDVQRAVDANVSRQNARLQPLPKGVSAQLLFDDRKVTITKSLTIIGRVKEVADVAFADDDQVSRHHAAVVYSEGEFFIEDLDSTNGTFLNGERVKRSPLNPGAEVRVGRRTFRLVVG
jgi:hypothetical protein